MRNWFAHPWLLIALAMVPALAVLAWRHARWRRRALAGMGVSARNVLVARRWPRRLRAVCLALGLLALGLGAAGPQWGYDWRAAAAPGRDLVVVLDRSRSMLAETPSRLSRARAALLELAESLKKRGGHRVALVAFAGRAKLLCPLTHDYDHFREVVESIDADAMDPDLAPAAGQASGTRIGRGLIEAVNALGDSPEAADIVLLSDGDDPARDGEWHAGAQAARAAGIAVLTIGIGDPREPSPVPAAGPVAERDRFSFEGKPIQSRLEEEPLRAIAELTGGQYELARTQPPPLSALYSQWVAARPLRDENGDALPVPRQRPVWFLLPAFALLASAVAMGDRMRRAKQ